MMFSKYISGLMQNIAYPPEVKKDKNILLHKLQNLKERAIAMKSKLDE